MITVRNTIYEIFNNLYRFRPLYKDGVELVLDLKTLAEPEKYVISKLDIYNKRKAELDGDWFYYVTRNLYRYKSQLQEIVEVRFEDELDVVNNLYSWIGEMKKDGKKIVLDHFRKIWDELSDRSELEDLAVELFGFDIYWLKDKV